MVNYLRGTARQAPVWLATGVILLGCGYAALTSWFNREPVIPVSARTAGAQDKLGMRLERLRRYDILHRFELILFDYRAQLAAHFAPPLATNLGVITIDDQTVRNLSMGYPLEKPYGLSYSRELYARVVRELSREGAKAMALDVIMADERPDHPMVENWLEGGMTTNVTSDAALAWELGHNPNVIIGTLTNLPPARRFRSSGARLGDVGSPHDIDGVERRVYAYVDCEYLSVALLNFCNRNGFLPNLGSNGVPFLVSLTNGPSFPLSLTTDRRFKDYKTVGSKQIPMGSREAFEKRRVWHMGIMLAALAQGLDLDQAVNVEGGVRLNSTNGNPPLFIPLDHHASLMVNWVARATELPSDRFDEMLRRDRVREKSPEAAVENSWSNKLVVIGSTATGNNISDVGATPLAESDFLISTYVNVANSVLQHRFVRRLPISGEMACEALLGAIGAWVTLRRRIVIAVLVVLGVGAAYTAVCFLLFVRFELWVPLAHPLITGLLSNHAVMLIWRVLFEQKEQRRVRGVFSKIVSPEVVHELLRTERHGLGGARRHLTVFFADVRGFTQMTDEVQAAAEEYARIRGLTGEAAEAYFESRASEVLTTVNTYLATIADVIKLHDGTLDKYIGDCVMAFWGAPIDEPLHAVRCVNAAIEAQRAIQKLNLERERENERRKAENDARIARGEPGLNPVPILYLGTGVNTGVMTVGLMGSETHIMNYTVFGRDVNLASRLEGVSGRSRIIIGHATYSELRRLAPELAAKCRALDPVAVKGFRDPVKIFEVPWEADLPVPAPNPEI